MTKSSTSPFRKIKDKLYGDLRKKQKKQFDNELILCCEEFTFIRWLDKIDFENEMNEKNITHLVLDERYDLGEILEHDLINPVHYEINTVLGIIGYTGSGKSWVVLRVIETISEAYWKFKKKRIKVHICSNYNEFVMAVVKSNIDDIIWCDELPLSTGKGSRTQKIQLENILHQIRQRKNTFLLVDPTRIKVDICYMYIKSAGINFNTGVSRFMLLNQSRKYFGHVYFYRPDTITEEYKKKKADQQIQIIDLRGKVSARDVKDIETKEEIDVIKRGIKILEKKLPDSRKNKHRDIYYIWKLYKENKQIYSFDMTAKDFGLDHGTVKNIFYELNKIVENY